jgi:hypothetical protein
MLSVAYAECRLCWVSLMLSVAYVECHLCCVSLMQTVTYAECRLCWLWLMLSVTYAECHWLSLMLSVAYADCHLCWVSLMLSLTCKPHLLSVVMLNVVMLSVVAPCKTWYLFCGAHYNQWQFKKMRCSICLVISNELKEVLQPWHQGACNIKFFQALNANKLER